MNRFTRWLLVVAVPFLIIVKSRLLVWAVGLNWTPESANFTLLISSMAGFGCFIWAIAPE